jgi:uncharacterized protein
MPIWELIITLLVFAVVAGYFSGLLGIGGGVLLVPIFISLFSKASVDPDVAPHLAVGTALALAAPAAAWGAWKEHRMGLLDTHYFRTWALSLLGGIVVALVLHRYISGNLLKILYTVFIFLTGVYIGFLREKIRFHTSWPHGWLKVCAAFSIGLLSALIGVSGGVFAGPFLSAFAIHLQQALSMALATAGVVGAVGGAGSILAGLGAPNLPQFAIGYVDWVVFLVMVVPMSVMAYFGAISCAKLPKRVIRVGYASFLFLMSLYMLLELTGTMAKIWGA